MVIPTRKLFRRLDCIIIYFQKKYNNRTFLQLLQKIILGRNYNVIVTERKSHPTSSNS